SFGLNGALLAPLLAGAPPALSERFVPENALRAPPRHPVTLFPPLATLFPRLLAPPELPPAARPAPRLAASRAARRPWELAEAWRLRTGVRIVRGYGMTELFRPISYLADDPADLKDAIGRPVPGVEVRVVDEDGRPLGAGEPGELLIRSPAA